MARGGSPAEGNCSGARMSPMASENHKRGSTITARSAGGARVHGGEEPQGGHVQPLIDIQRRAEARFEIFAHEGERDPEGPAQQPGQSKDPYAGRAVQLARRERRNLHYACSLK